MFFQRDTEGQLLLDKQTWGGFECPEFDEQEELAWALIQKIHTDYRKQTKQLFKIKFDSELTKDDEWNLALINTRRQETMFEPLKKNKPKP